MTTPQDVQPRIAHLAEATSRLLDALAAVPAQTLRDPSLLPNWTVGHVATHLARNAEALGNLLHWAATGVETPMYASPGTRDQDIETGAGREPEEILDDLTASCRRLAQAIEEQPEQAWSALVSMRRGGPVPSDIVLDARLAEVELHHHDLGVDAGLALLDGPAGAALLAAVVRTYVRSRDLGGLVVVPDDGEPITLTGSADGDPTHVRGSAAAIAGWLTGRTDGADLICDGALPDLEAW